MKLLSVLSIDNITFYEMLSFITLISNIKNQACLSVLFICQQPKKCNNYQWQENVWWIQIKKHSLDSRAACPINCVIIVITILASTINQTLLVAILYNLVESVYSGHLKCSLLSHKQ